MPQSLRDYSWLCSAPDSGDPVGGQAARDDGGGDADARHGRGPGKHRVVDAALTLYSEILDRIEEMDFAVFAQRATVTNGRRLRVASVGLARALTARIRHREA